MSVPGQVAGGHGVVPPVSITSLDGARPVASVSAGALRANAVIAAASSSSPADMPGPLAFDGWGHGAEWVEGVLSGEGISASRRPEVRADLLFGLTASAHPVRPVMRLAGTVLATKPLLAGEGVSYGYAHRAPQDTRVALVTGGYAQGVVRALGGRAEVRIGGARHRIVGRVAMDVCVVDIGEANVSRGDEAVFFGDPRRGEPSIEEWAEMLGWSAGELVAAVGRTARRVVVP